jgi:hypothetical protein
MVRMFWHLCFLPECRPIVIHANIIEIWIGELALQCLQLIKDLDSVKV